VDRFGRYDAEEVLAAIRPDTALVAVQLANHEVGTLQPAADVVAGARERGVVVHVDACAAAGHVPVDFDGLSADLCSATAHQFGDPSERLPHLVCFGIGGIEAEPVLLALDQHGVAVHSGSSCSSETLEPSPVLAAMGVDADHSLRVSVGWSSTEADVDA